MGIHVHPGKGEFIPDAYRSVASVPNIMTTREEHTHCWRQDRSVRSNLGDVRYCKHGKIQVLLEPARGGMLGPGTWFWYTLSPVWDFGTYRRAKKALGKEKT